MSEPTKVPTWKELTLTESREANALMDRLERSLTNVSPSPGQILLIEELRAEAKQLGSAIASHCPHSRERSLAVTHLEDAVMWAVKSILLNYDPRVGDRD